MADWLVTGLTALSLALAWIGLAWLRTRLRQTGGGTNAPFDSQDHADQRDLHEAVDQTHDAQQQKAKVKRSVTSY